MRGLRRIHGDPRFSADNALNDLGVRRSLGVDSVDALLLIARMRYLGRLVRQRPPTLVALLHFTSGARRLPWVDLVARDTAMLSTLRLLPEGFPTFDGDPAAWSEMMHDSAAWARVLDGIVFAESACDAQAVPTADDAGPLARALHFT